jgi:hypothetical protein
MKKLLYLGILIPFIFASCSNELTKPEAKEFLKNKLMENRSAEFMMYHPDCIAYEEKVFARKVNDPTKELAQAYKDFNQVLPNYFMGKEPDYSDPKPIYYSGYQLIVFDEDDNVNDKLNKVRPFAQIFLKYSPIANSDFIHIERRDDPVNYFETPKQHIIVTDSYASKLSWKDENVRLKSESIYLTTVKAKDITITNISYFTWEDMEIAVVDFEFSDLVTTEYNKAFGWGEATECSGYDSWGKTMETAYFVYDETDWRFDCIGENMELSLYLERSDLYGR